MNATSPLRVTGEGAFIDTQLESRDEASGETRDIMNVLV
jgi:hypothetical protein